MKRLVSVLICLAALQLSLAIAAPFYLRSTVGAPWGVSTNEAAMDSVFGAGMWTDARYETVVLGTLLSPGTNFIFMEGGDDNADELEAFLVANLAAIEAWVAAGGMLLLNAAPNEGDGMSYGFGGVTLTYTAFSSTATAVDPGHPIFGGPFLPTTPSMTGTFYSHASVSGGGVSAILTGDAGTLLAELGWGSGWVLFGGMTTTNFHSPGAETFNLRANMIDYTVAGGLIPEPGTLLSMGTGLILAALLARRRR